MFLRLIVACNLLVFLLPEAAISSDNWEKKALLELSKTSNAITLPQWKLLEDFEKQALYETRHIKRIDVKLALSISQNTKSTIISVDEPNYYRRQKIIPSINIPYSKFSLSFVKKNLKSFRKMGVIILYCR